MTKSLAQILDPEAWEAFKDDPQFKPKEPQPMTNSITTLDDFLKDAGIKHFSAKEVLTLRRLGVTVDPPPRDWWPRMLPTLDIAEKIRAELGHPLIVGNGFRPEPYNSRVGGARRSQHLFFRALDLDLPRSHKSESNQRDFYEVAGRIFLDIGRTAKMGLGLYRLHRGTRVHVDTGYRRRHWKRKYTAPLLDSLR